MPPKILKEFYYSIPVNLVLSVYFKLAGWKVGHKSSGLSYVSTVSVFIWCGCCRYNLFIEEKYIFFMCDSLNDHYNFELQFQGGIKEKKCCMSPKEKRKKERKNVFSYCNCLKKIQSNYI